MLADAPSFSLAGLFEADLTEDVADAGEAIGDDDGCGEGEATAGCLPTGATVAEAGRSEDGVTPTGSGWAPPGSFAEEAGGGRGAADADENPARSCSSV